LSPDGRWVAYAALEGGEMQVFVRSFPDRGGHWQVSTAGGMVPRWSVDGGSLYFVDGDNRLMVAAVQFTGDSISTAPPRPWTTAKVEVAAGLTTNYSPSSDGKRVLMLVDSTTGQKPEAHVHLVLNFFDEVNRRLRAVETK
jgi:serine/threonine-protein kinase